MACITYSQVCGGEGGPFHWDVTVGLMWMTSWSWSYESVVCIEAQLSHYGLLAIYVGDINLRQHWPRQWFVVWPRQILTRTNVEFSSVKLCGIHLRAILRCVLKLLFWAMCLKTIPLTLLLPHTPGSVDLKTQQIARFVRHSCITLGFSCWLFMVPACNLQIDQLHLLHSRHQCPDKDGIS